MPILQLIYGPHDNSDYKVLDLILKKVLKNMEKKSKNICTIIENAGPSNTDLNQFIAYDTKFTEKKAFEFLNKMPYLILKNITEKNKYYYSYGILIYKLSKFQINLINCFQGHKILFELQSYDDWKKCRSYINDGDFKGSIEEKNKKFIKNIKPREMSLIKQIKEKNKVDKEANFIIVRGDLHRYYFNLIKNKLKKYFKIPNNLFYGNLFNF